MILEFSEAFHIYQASFCCVRVYDVLISSCNRISKHYNGLIRIGHVIWYQKEKKELDMWKIQNLTTVHFPKRDPFLYFQISLYFWDLLFLICLDFGVLLLFLFFLYSILLSVSSLLVKQNKLVNGKPGQITSVGRLVIELAKRI